MPTTLWFLVNFSNYATMMIVLLKSVLLCTVYLPFTVFFPTFKLSSHSFFVMCFVCSSLRFGSADPLLTRAKRKYRIPPCLFLNGLLASYWAVRILYIFWILYICISFIRYVVYKYFPPDLLLIFPFLNDAFLSNSFEFWWSSFQFCLFVDHAFSVT